MGGAEPHLCFSFNVAQRCKLLLCIVDVTTEPWPKKTNGVWTVGSFLETISFQVDAIADVWCMYMMHMSSYDSPMFGLRHSFRFWWKLKKMALNVRNFLFSWVQFHLLNGWLSGSFKFIRNHDMRDISFVTTCVFALHTWSWEYASSKGLGTNSSRFHGGSGELCHAVYQFIPICCHDMKGLGWEQPRGIPISRKKFPWALGRSEI